MSFTQELISINHLTVECLDFNNHCHCQRAPEALRTARFPQALFSASNAAAMLPTHRALAEHTALSMQPSDSVPPTSQFPDEMNHPPRLPRSSHYIVLAHSAPGTGAVQCNMLGALNEKRSPQARSCV